MAFLDRQNYFKNLKEIFADQHLNSGRSNPIT